MKKADQIEIRPVSYRNQKVVTSMIDGLCKDLQATGLSVSHSWHDGGRLEVCISDGSAVIYDVTEVYPFKSDSTGEIVIANRLARLLELKIVENRIDDLYFDALYLGWRLRDITNVSVVGLTQKDGTYITMPNGNTIVSSECKLLVIGSGDNIRDTKRLIMKKQKPREVDYV